MVALATWTTVVLVLLACAVLAVALFAGIRALLNGRTSRVAQSVIRDPEEHTVTDEDGAVRSVQGADITMPEDQLEEIWSPEYLERLARTYWRFLTRATLGLIRVAYTEQERFIVLLFRPLVLLSFQAPEYEMDADRGIVRWRIEKGILVSRAGRGGNGYLEIDVRRIPGEESGRAGVHVEVEVANFYPSIASGIGRWVYANTQSRIHVIVTHAFLRSLARLDFATSKVGRWANHPGAADLPDPSPARRTDPEPAGRGLSGDG
jgi:hypothetical protein